MGRVFLGRSAGGRPVAVKVIRADLGADPEFRERFRREVAAAQKVNGLYTALVVDADLDGPTPWLATAYVAGPSLADAVGRHGPLPVTAVSVLAAGLAEGLAAIHAAGLVHRDLKPSNVLLADDGPRVIDFGISRAAEASVLTRTGLVIGSPGFMSPEQAEGREVGTPSDVFSLGAVLTFAATGQGPFGTGPTAALVYRIVHAQPTLDGIPAQLRPLIERCLAKHPGRRPTTADVLAEVGDPDLGDGWLPAAVIDIRPRPAGSRPDHSSRDATPAASRDYPDTVATRSEGGGPQALSAVGALRAGPQPAGAPTFTPGPQPAGAPTFTPVSQPAGAAAFAATIGYGNAGGPGAAAPGSAAPGSASPGSASPGSAAPGSATPGSASRGSASPGRSGAGGRAYLRSPRIRGLALAAGAVAVAVAVAMIVVFTASSPGSPPKARQAQLTLAGTLTDPDSQGVMSLAFTADGDDLAAADRKGATYLWYMGTRGIAYTISDKNFPSAVAASPGRPVSRHRRPLRRRLPGGHGRRCPRRQEAAPAGRATVRGHQDGVQPGQQHAGRQRRRRPRLLVADGHRPARQDIFRPRLR